MEASKIVRVSRIGGRMLRAKMSSASTHVHPFFVFRLGQHGVTVFGNDARLQGGTDKASRGLLAAPPGGLRRIYKESKGSPTRGRVRVSL